MDGSGVDCTSRPSDPDLAGHSGLQRTVAGAQFLTWWTTNYPLQHHGVPAVIEAGDDLRIEDLLAAGFSVDRLEAMALALWAITADDNPFSDRSWIARYTDRAIRILKQKAGFLARVVVAQAQPGLFGPVELVPLTARELEEAKAIRTRAWGGWCRHAPRHSDEDWRECVRAIALKRRVG